VAGPTVSLIVPVRNEEGHISACLEGIARQTYPAELIEVIVVDGESSDATAALVARAAKADPRIRLLSNSHRTMPTGLNQGIGAATGEYVGVVSGHSVLPNDYVSRAVAAMESTGAWSVGGRIVRRAEGSRQAAIALATSSRIGVGDSRHNYAERAGWVETVFPGFWRQELFEHIGPFDPAMVANEDNELSLRIHKAGGQIWYDPAIRVDYSPRDTLRGLFLQYRRYGLGKMRVLRKHRGGLRWRHLVPAAWVAFLLLGAGLSLLVRPFVIAWLLGIVLYVVVIVVAGARLQRPDVPWWRISAALAVLHLAYGLGTWQGLATWWLPTRRRP
jgi:succinoglycan biosynthesis protein ExoA